MPTSDPDTPAPPKPKKATNAVVLQRVEEVLAIRLDGAQLHDIRRYASENWSGTSKRPTNCLSSGDRRSGSG
jgi:hypothetical protein